ncbi:MAG: thioredoxin domain-containing protein, partial [Nitriliruptorales bacterium]|nr:thioredoxin domain-containing protein [Nitriliruptorales bacterium]
DLRDLVATVPTRQEGRSINRLADETSPYLLQHADNPVEWLPWGPEAFEEARRRDVPIFLSVGYSSCHWCHVMAHESFEDDDTAEVLNEHFVNVKVDREERPDVDAVYMEAVQALTGRGGWPMSVFLTPSGEPFYAGTYWPAEPRGGMPSFRQVLASVLDAWRTKREDVEEQAAAIKNALDRRTAAEAEDAVDLSLSDDAARLVVDRAWDRQDGGFGRAPKFPQAMLINFLLLRHVRSGEEEVLEAATHSLDAMARGGIYDHVGGGFARYSTDGRWLVPHFEKMLYDNALLLAAYARAATLTGGERFDRVVRETADYLLRDMRHEGGAFYAATDADSEGEEGRFFVWSREEFSEVVSGVGGDPDRWAAFFGVSEQGNWEGTNILHEPVPRARFVEERELDPDEFAKELEAVRQALYDRREERVHPGLDDKILASWNGLAITGLALAGVHLGERRYVEAAQAAARFVEEHHLVDGVLHHTWKDGHASVPAFLEDVGALAWAYLTLYEITGEVRWFERARELADDAVSRFHDDTNGGYFQTAHDAADLYTRPKEVWDNATPSGNSLLADVFVRLAALTGDHTWRERGEEIVALLQGGIRRAPTGFGQLLQTVEFLLAGPREVAIVGDEEARTELVEEYWSWPRPGTVLAVAAPASDAADVVPLLAGRGEVDGKAAAYVCHDFVCDRPVTEPAALAVLLAR